MDEERFEYKGSLHQTSYFFSGKHTTFERESGLLKWKSYFLGGENIANKLINIKVQMELCISVTNDLFHFNNFFESLVHSSAILNISEVSGSNE